MNVSFRIDKAIAVPPGQIVRTGYVHVDRVRIACKAPMAIQAVAEKYELVKQNAPNSIFPAPIGHWEGGTFVLIDGRHTFFAYVLNGYDHVLVAWLETPPKP